MMRMSLHGKRFQPHIPLGQPLHTGRNPVMPIRRLSLLIVRRWKVRWHVFNSPSSNSIQVSR